MITFEQAQQTVSQSQQDLWPAEASFITPPWGYENEEVYVVPAGPYARFYGARNETEERWEEPALDDLLLVVDKTTGELSYGEALSPPADLTPVGEEPPFGP